MLLGEELVKEAKGDYSIETSPGVYYFYDTSDNLVSTVRFREDHYIIKYRGSTRADVYRARAEKMAKLVELEKVEGIVELIGTKPVKPVKALAWV